MGMKWMRVKSARTRQDDWCNLCSRAGLYEARLVWAI